MTVIENTKLYMLTEGQIKYVLHALVLLLHLYVNNDIVYINCLLLLLLFSVYSLRFYFLFLKKNEWTEIKMASRISEQAIT